MAARALCYKENEGLMVDNSIGLLSSGPSINWWGAFGSKSVNYSQPYHSLFKSASMEKSTDDGGQLTAVKDSRRETEQGYNTIQFAVFPGDCKISCDGLNPPQTLISLQKALPELGAHIDLRFGQPMICAKYSVDQCYGLFSTYESQIQGRVMLPTNMTTGDGPIFVNPKQYHGIIRRRKSRAKAELQKTSTRNRKPYMHLSRHLHAMRRPRGTGGRFLNSGNVKPGTEAKISRPTDSQSSEILESDSATLNSSSKQADGGGSNVLGSEVTSSYSKRDINHHLVESFSFMMDNGNWIARSTDNLKEFTQLGKFKL